MSKFEEYVTEDLDRIASILEILISRVEELEDRLAVLMETQHIEPYTIELSDDETNRIKQWVVESHNLPKRFRDIGNGE